jgi:hypothetical protein
MSQPIKTVDFEEHSYADFKFLLFSLLDSKDCMEYALIENYGYPEVPGAPGSYAPVPVVVPSLAGGANEAEQAVHAV